MITLREGALLAGGAIVVGTGMWLTGASRPYGTPLLMVHKLVDIVAIVAVAFVVYRALSQAGAASITGLAVPALMAVVAVAALVSGGMVSAMEPVAAPILWLHRVTGFVLPVVAGYAVVRLA